MSMLDDVVPEYVLSDSPRVRNIRSEKKLEDDFVYTCMHRARYPSLRWLDGDLTLQ